MEKSSKKVLVDNEEISIAKNASISVNINVKIKIKVNLSILFCKYIEFRIGTITTLKDKTTDKKSVNNEGWRVQTKKLNQANW